MYVTYITNTCHMLVDFRIIVNIFDLINMCLDVGLNCLEQLKKKWKKIITSGITLYFCLV